MKARVLKTRLRELGFWDSGKGGKHEKWVNGVYSVAVPRHKEIAEGTARAIIKEAERFTKK